MGFTDVLRGVAGVLGETFAPEQALRMQQQRNQRIAELQQGVTSGVVDPNVGNQQIQQLGGVPVSPSAAAQSQKIALEQQQQMQSQITPILQDQSLSPQEKAYKVAETRAAFGDQAAANFLQRSAQQSRQISLPGNRVQDQQFNPQTNTWENVGSPYARFAKTVEAPQAEGGGISEDTKKFYADMSLRGDFSWKTGLARSKGGSAIVTAVENYIPQRAKELGMGVSDLQLTKAEYASLSKTLVDRTKYVATANQFVNNFQKQADLVDKYLVPGVGGATPVINRWLQAGRQKVAGDPEVSAFDTAIRGLAREHQRIVTGVTSNAQLHASAQETADELLNKDMTAAQVRSTLGVMREEAHNALTSGREELDDIKSQIKGLGQQIPEQKPAAGWSARIVK